eukprot:Sspe_Gene.69946::Locus_41295_Transcript_1_1_Confidence_1.000_Length_501::g.69946::m.69946
MRKKKDYLAPKIGHEALPYKESNGGYLPGLGDGSEQHKRDQERRRRSTYNLLPQPLQGSPAPPHPPAGIPQPQSQPPAYQVPPPQTAAPPVGHVPPPYQVPPLNPSPGYQAQPPPVPMTASPSYNQGV